jgi:hypothetical protein
MVKKRLVETIGQNNFCDRLKLFALPFQSAWIGKKGVGLLRPVVI